MKQAVPVEEPENTQAASFPEAVLIRLEEFPPPPSMSWCFAFVWRMTVAIFLIGVPVALLFAFIFDYWLR